jgi:hypothetical protein
MRRCLLLAIVVAASSAVAAEPAPQDHEVRADLDISALTDANIAAIDAQYTYSPAGIDRNDDEPPILRRFLLHPASVDVRVLHFGGTREAITSLRAGLELNPLDGMLFVAAEGGFGRHLTPYAEPFEFGYWFATVTGEVGVRPANWIRVSGFYTGEPILGPDRGEMSANQAERSGAEQRFGGNLTFVTPDDRVFTTLSGYGRVTDWTFVYTNPGTVSVRGIGASARVALLITPGLTFQVHGFVQRDHWVDQRAGDNGSASIGGDVDRQVVRANAQADVIFWSKGRYGFRLSLGGGWEGAPPEIDARGSAVISLGVGSTVRF